MQNTRISTIVNVASGQISRWSSQSWRRKSLILISLLLGFFLASVISTSAGAKSNLDIEVAAVTVFIVEMISRFTYSTKRVTLADGSLVPRKLIYEMLNSLKIGVTYGLFLEAFKLGS